MKYYSYLEPTEEGNVIFTKSEQEIIDSYYEWWYAKMCKRFGKDYADANYTKHDCIDDWVVTHWAWEVNSDRSTEDLLREIDRLQAEVEHWKKARNDALVAGDLLKDELQRLRSM